MVSEILCFSNLLWIPSIKTPHAHRCGETTVMRSRHKGGSEALSSELVISRKKEEDMLLRENQFMTRDEKIWESGDDFGKGKEPLRLSRQDKRK